MKTFKYTQFAILIFASVVLFGAGCSVYNDSAEKPNSWPTEADVKANTTTGTKLDLSNQGLSEFPKYLLAKTDLQELNLSNNKLSGALPAEIRQLKNLQKINLSYNLMTGVPAEIGQLSKLTELDLSYNQLTGLPYELGNLSNLKILNLTGNKYSTADLDVILKKLPNLTVIK